MAKGHFPGTVTGSQARKWRFFTYAQAGHGRARNGGRDFKPCGQCAVDSSYSVHDVRGMLQVTHSFTFYSVLPVTWTSVEPISTSHITDTQQSDSSCRDSGLIMHPV
jgi:hypothetical protein